MFPKFYSPDIHLRRCSIKKKSVRELWKCYFPRRDSNNTKQGSQRNLGIKKSSWSY